MVISEILGLSVKTLTSDDKYSCYKRENFPQAIQIQLPKKPKTFYEFLISFLESTSNFKLFQKKYESDSSVISVIIDSESSCYLNVLKVYLRTPLVTQCVGWSKTLMKSNRQEFAQLLHFYGLNWIVNYHSL